jgi:hypothetical protein
MNRNGETERKWGIREGERVRERKRGRESGGERETDREREREREREGIERREVEARFARLIELSR